MPGRGRCCRRIEREEVDIGPIDMRGGAVTNRSSCRALCGFKDLGREVAGNVEVGAESRQPLAELLDRVRVAAARVDLSVGHP